MPVPLVDFPPTTRLFLWMLVFAMIVTQSVISVGDFIRCERHTEMQVGHCPALELASRGSCLKISTTKVPVAIRY